MKNRMLDALKNSRLSFKFILLGIGSVLITAFALVAVAVIRSEQYNALAQREIDWLIDTDLDHITQGVYMMVRTENEAVQQQIDENIKVARYIIQHLGGISLAADSTQWRVVNQDTLEESDLSLPKVMIGRKWLGQKYAFSEESPVVDEVTHLTGATATVFQRMNERGDMLRIASSVPQKGGERATGSFIPALSRDGGPNPVIDAILNGQIFHGRAQVLGEWYLTTYEPLQDESGDLMGMLYVGVRQKMVEDRVRQAIIDTRVGRTGYVYILGGKGGQRGRYIVSQGGERDGEDVWDSQDSEGNYIIRDIVRLALQLKPGEKDSYHYYWQNPGEIQPRLKIARLAYYEPWDWIIGTSVYEDELQEYRNVLRSGRNRMIRYMIAAGLFISLLVGLAAILLTMTIIRPLRRLQHAVEIISEGNLAHEMVVHSDNEIGRLSQAFNLMREKLNKTVRGLKESEEKYRKIFENAIEGLFQTSFDGRFLSANSALARILGYDSPDELMTRVRNIGTQLYVHSEARQALLSDLKKNGEVSGREMEWFCKNGQKKWISLSVRIIFDAENIPLYLEGFITDISQHKKLEQQLRQSQKMEALGTLTGGIAHDFNNILTAIIGYGNLMHPELPQDSPLKHYLDELLSAADRATQMTQSLLAFSRKQAISLKVLDLNALIGKIDRFLLRVIGEDIDFKTYLAQEQIHILADGSQIEQVLMNLVANARDAMPSGGSLILKTEVVDSAGESAGFIVPEGRYALITISDTGHGMDERVQKRLFEPFFTTKEVGRGTGLGLAIVYGIIKQHQGEISVYSELGGGTTFKIYLPLTDAEEKDEALVASQGVLTGHETILLAEDDDLVRKLMRTILETNGYTVIEATDGEDAVQKFGEHEARVNLLLLDVIMPKKNGKEALVEIRRQRPDIHALFLSGYTADIIQKKGILDETVDLVMKPANPITLLTRIRKLLDAES